MLSLLESFGCSEEILTITAMLQVNHAFHQPTRQKANAVRHTHTPFSSYCIFYFKSQAKRKFCVYEGDHLTLLNVYNAFIRVSCIIHVLNNLELQYNQDPRWCQQNFIHYKSKCYQIGAKKCIYLTIGLCHAVSIREQLKRLLHRFKIKLVSCHGKKISS